MGGGSWSSTNYVSHAKKKGLISESSHVDANTGHIDWGTYAATSMAAHEVFQESQLNQALNPHNVKIRESRDSEEHPFSTAVAMLLDVTGSMNVVAKYIAQNALPKLMEEIYKRKPVTDPQVMFMGFDDLEVHGHLQVSQFESDIRIAEQLQLLWLENMGGGNDYESYSLPWYFLANHTSIDCFEKRGKKGYAISMGDELPNPHLDTRAMDVILGYKPQAESTHLSTKKILEMVRKKYHVFHVITEEGSFARSNLSAVRQAWQNLLGEEYVLSLPDYTKLSETVISAIEIAEGKDPKEVAASWEDKKIIEVVTKATKTLKRVVEL